MKQILLIWFLNFGLDFVICDNCIKYSEFLEKRTCINGMNNRKCEWTDKIISDKVQQQKNGNVNVRIPMLETCDLSNHMLMLLVNTNITSIEKCGQDAMVDTKWYIHTEIEFKPYLNCSVEEKNNVPVIRFDHVFTGCYKIKIHNADEGMDVYESDVFSIRTDYRKQLLTGKNSITMQPRTVIKGEIIETIITINTNETNKPPDANISLGEMSDESKNIKGQIKTEWFDEESKNFSVIFQVCESLPNVSFDCKSEKNYYNNTVYTCQYKGLHPGEYIFHYKLLNEYTRCNKNTLWAKPGMSCDGILNITVPKISYIEPVVYEPPSSFGIEFYIIIFIIIIALAVFIICTVVYLHRKVSKNKIIKGTPIPQYHILNKSNETVLTDVSREVLFIYTRESELFCEIISSFKELYGQDENISIFDINEYNEEIHIDPQDWIMKKISNPKTTVILFLNICSLMIYEKYPNITYKDEECQDKLFVFAIKQLQIATNRDERNFFVVQLDNFPIEEPVFKSLPVEKRYIMPRDVQILLSKFVLYDQDVHGNSLDKFRNSCRKHEELYKDSVNYINSVFINLH